MKKSHLLMNLSVSLGIVLPVLSACTQTTPTQQVSSDLTDGYAWHQMVFPKSDAEKTDLNKGIFEVTPYKKDIDKFQPFGRMLLKAESCQEVDVQKTLVPLW